MENRFGFKDFVLATLILLLIVVILLGMKQLDRQWDQLQVLNSNGDRQTRLLADIQRTLSQGISVTNSGPATTQQSANQFPHGDPFANMEEAEKNPDFARGDWIIDNFGTKLAKIKYPISSDLYSYWVQAKVLESLVYQDPDTLEYHPQLARDWTISDDGMTFTFELRKGVMFSDGEPFTADDVIYSYQLIMNPKINAPRQRAYYAKVKSVEKTRDDEVVFKMNEHYFEAMDLCGGLTIVPKHFFSKFGEEEINNNPGLLMGTGPYRLKDPSTWRPGEKMELFRNELYWGQPATFNRWIFLEVEEGTAEETMFKNQQLDVYAPQPEQYKRLLVNPTTSTYSNHYEYDTPMSGYNYIAWNERYHGQPTLFSDAKVKRTMTMLTDRQRICHDVFLDFATPTSGPFGASSPQADPAVKLWPFDIAAGQKLLADAGYTSRDNSGVLKNTEGRPFSFKLTYPSKSATLDRVVLLLKDTYAKAGVEMIQDPVDWPILQKKLDERDFDAITLGWGGSIESDMYQEFDSSQMADQGDNFMSYSNPELDKVMRNARETVDPAKRMPLWHEAHRLLHEDQPYTFLFSRMSLRFMAKRIQNVRKSKVGLNYIATFSMPCPWYVPKAMQKYTD